MSGRFDRIVSLVPSLTELLFFLGARERVVGATRFCVEPSGARAVFRVGGTKNPDLAAICHLEPDLILANAEENRREDLDALDAAGLRVFVTFPRTIDTAIELCERVGVLVGFAEKGRSLRRRLEEAREAVTAEVAGRARPKVFCPIWRRPWMSFNRDTFAHDVIETAGGDNLCADAPNRYPEVSEQSMRENPPDIVLLPSEPYRFTTRHLPDVANLFGADAMERIAVRLVDGRALTWHGPRIDWALGELRNALSLV